MQENVRNLFEEEGWSPPPFDPFGNRDWRSLKSGVLISEIQEIRQYPESGEIFLLNRVSQRLYQKHLKENRGDLELLISSSEEFDLVRSKLPETLPFSIGDRVQMPDLVRGEVLDFYEVPGFNALSSGVVEIGGDGHSESIRLQRTYYYYPPEALELHRSF